MSATKRDLSESNGLLPEKEKCGGDPMHAEKFSVFEVAELRSELLQSGLDARDAAELMQTFLAGGAMGFLWRRRERRRLRWKAQAARWK